jgi:glycosyltransferase involved in cell wall biosynthesis
MRLPADLLVERGAEVILGRPVTHDKYGYGAAHDGGGLFGFDVAMFKLIMDNTVVSQFNRMQQNGQRVIVDIDDFHFGLPESNIAHMTTNPRMNSQSNRMHYEAGIRQADRLIVSTDYLREFYERRHRDVVVVRNGLDTERFTAVAQPEIPVFGWVGGTLWRNSDVEMLASWLPDFVKDHGVQVYHGGHIPGDSQHFGVRAGLSRVATKPMKRLHEYPTLFNDLHVGFVPLVDSPFNRSKSFLKGLEYAASGIPFIASPTYEYELLHEAGVGRLASTPDEWRDHAAELLDLGVREAEAERQRSIVVEQFDISVRGDEWYSAIFG